MSVPPARHVLHPLFYGVVDVYIDGPDVLLWLGDRENLLTGSSTYRHLHASPPRAAEQ